MATPRAKYHGSNKKRRASPVALTVLFAALAVLAASGARAQDDGPRVYMLAPEGARALTVFAVAKQGNEEPEVGTVVPGSNFETNIVVFRYVQTFSLAGRQFAPFLIVPFGRTTTLVNALDRGAVESSSGLGDIQIGGVLGLIGSPALSAQDYAAAKPGFSTGLFAKVYLPTGAYNAAQAVNLGANRFAYQLGLPTTLALGTSYRDPALTTLEVFPTLTFYQANYFPHGANTVAKDPLFSVEAHLTHSLSRAFWVSADLLYRQGGETFTDGLGANNATQGLSGGASAAFVLGRKATLILTYERVIERNDDGPDGFFFRSALVLPF
jgi:Putative MetA-pathway of phenol degradation